MPPGPASSTGTGRPSPRAAAGRRPLREARRLRLRVKATCTHYGSGMAGGPDLRPTAGGPDLLPTGRTSRPASVGAVLIGVTGATGEVGTRVARRLAER